MVMNLLIRYLTCLLAAMFIVHTLFGLIVVHKTKLFYSDIFASLALLVPNKLNLFILKHNPFIEMSLFMSFNDTENAV